MSSKNLSPEELKAIKALKLAEQEVQQINDEVEYDEEFDKKYPKQDLKLIGLKAFATPDSDAVMRGCEFIKNFSKNDNFSDFDNKNQRLALYSVTARLENGRRLTHDIASTHPNYEPEKTEDEIELGYSLSGPRLCENINIYYKDCEHCKHFNSKIVTSPIKIKSMEFVKTKSTGFWNIVPDKLGKPVPKSPNYNDLLKNFENINDFITIAGYGLIYVYKENYWHEFNQDYIRAYVQNSMNPKPRDTHRKEFLSLIKCTNLKDQDWLNQSIDGFINLKNGVYNIQDDTLLKHSDKYGFRYMLPYEYDEDAECPRFVQFLDEITLGKTDVQEVLMEFIGYSLANGPCFAEKAMILFGGGSNGKSTFMDVLKALGGKDNYASLSLTALNKDTKRYLIDGKLFNIGEETSVKALGESDVFKTMVTGGEIDVKKLFVQDYTIKNRAKLIMACNELPKSSDRSDGLYRRMLLIPFDAKFSDSTKDPEIREKLFKELPGIFNLALQGYKRLKANKWQFTESETLKSTLEEYRVENDNIVQWFREHLRFDRGPDAFEFKAEVYLSYKEFCLETGNYVINQTAFFKTIKLFLPKYEEGRRLHKSLLKKERTLKFVKLGQYDTD